MGQTVKKVEKETHVTSTHGNNNFTAVLVIGCMTAFMLLGAILSQRRSAVNLYEKRLERTVSVVAERNLHEAGEQFSRE